MRIRLGEEATFVTNRRSEGNVFRQILIFYLFTVVISKPLEIYD